MNGMYNKGKAFLERNLVQSPGYVICDARQMQMHLGIVFVVEKAPKSEFEAAENVKEKVVTCMADLESTKRNTPKYLSILIRRRHISITCATRADKRPPYFLWLWSTVQMTVMKQ